MLRGFFVLGGCCLGLFYVFDLRWVGFGGWLFDLCVCLGCCGGDVFFYTVFNGNTNVYGLLILSWFWVWVR